MDNSTRSTSDPSGYTAMPSRAPGRAPGKTFVVPIGRTGQITTTVAGAAVFLLFGVVLIVAGLGLRTHGFAPTDARTIGHVTGTRTVDYSRGSACEVTVSYRVGGRRYRTTGDPAELCTRRRGDLIRVDYRTAEPAHAYLHDDSRGRVAGGFMLLFGAFLAPVGGWALYGRARGNYRLT